MLRIHWVLFTGEDSDSIPTYTSPQNQPSPEAATSAHPGKSHVQTQWPNYRLSHGVRVFNKAVKTLHHSLVVEQGQGNVILFLSNLGYCILWLPPAKDNVTHAVCGGLNESGPDKLIDLNVGHQRMALLERIKGCGGWREVIH